MKKIARVLFPLMLVIAFALSAAACFTTSEVVELEVSGNFKTAYAIGQTFDKAGMVVTGTLEDGTTRKVTSFTVSPSRALTAADEKITVSHSGISVEIPIAVKSENQTVLDAYVKAGYVLNIETAETRIAAEYFDQFLLLGYDFDFILGPANASPRRIFVLVDAPSAQLANAFVIGLFEEFDEYFDFRIYGANAIICLIGWDFVPWKYVFGPESANSRNVEILRAYQAAGYYLNPHSVNTDPITDILAELEDFGIDYEYIIASNRFFILFDCPDIATAQDVATWYGANYTVQRNGVDVIVFVLGQDLAPWSFVF
ncbi:MAG: bacterial Ig-like domain-containing protein [Firmicutes bacterium]|nr:bacterial Ig-like domain-containing protein [Bacillota bacterium]